MENKNWLVLLLMKIFALVMFVVSIIEDVSTFLREGGKGSAFSSRRGYAFVFVVTTIYTISLAIRSFADLLRYGWIAALVFIPSIICGILAIVFSYYASSKDFNATISVVGEAISGSVGTFDLPDMRARIPGEKIGKHRFDQGPNSSGSGE